MLYFYLSANEICTGPPSPPGCQCFVVVQNPKRNSYVFGSIIWCLRQDKTCRCTLVAKNSCYTYGDAKRARLLEQINTCTQRNSR
jgi:hypothetical protein